MPNTLAHFGVQGLLGHRFLSWSDPKWIFLGCIIPDVPWILQRLVHWLALPVDFYDLRLYAICQATLFGCLLLSGALAFLFPNPKPVFIVLAINSFAHLVLDATQLKWANGVHLFAPFSWDLWNLGWYWPESVVTYTITALGLVFLTMTWRQALAQPLIPNVPSRRNACVAGLCFIAYFLVPFLLMSGAEEADNHFVQTLRNTETRVGRAVEFDRVPYLKKKSGDVIQTMSKEYLKVVTNPLPHSALVSIRGRFASPDSLEVLDLHVHSSWFRDAASVLGLGILGIFCVGSIIRKVPHGS